jgi:hypothetical protein
MQDMTKFGMWHNGMFALFNKILNLPMNLPKALSDNILVLNYINFQCVLYFGSPSFSPLKEE